MNINTENNQVEIEAAERFNKISDLLTERTKHFLTIGFSILYVSYFAMFSFTKEMFSTDIYLWSGLFVTISFGSFLYYVISLILALNTASGMLLAAKRENPNSNVNALNSYIAKQNSHVAGKYNRFMSMIYFINMWIGIGTAIIGVGLLFISFVIELLR